MHGASISTYLLEVLLLSVFPGPTVCTVLAFSSQQRMSLAMALTAGILSANAVAIAASGALRATGFLLPTFLYLPLASLGAVLLMLIGLRMVLQTLGEHDSPPRPRSSSMAEAFAYGFLIHASNPRTLTFFTSIFLSSVPLNAAYVRTVFMLGLTAIAIDLIVLSTYAALAPYLSPKRVRSSILGRTPLLAGIVLMGWGGVSLVGHIMRIMNGV